MKEREEAFDEELENMGYSSNRSSIRLSITNSKNSGNFSIPFVGESVRPLSANSVRFSERPTVSNAIRTSVRKVPPVFLLNKANGELGAVGASHCKDQPISISEAGHKSLHDSEPYKVKTRSLEAELVALRTTSLTQSQSADDNSVDNMSDSTSTTVKWRDTKDAEFCFQHEELESDQVNLETFSWHLVESSNSSVTSSHKKDEEGQLSSRSSNTFAQSLNRLFSDAAEVVKSVLPSSYSDFRFKDFCPKLFIQVRNLCGINGEHYAKSFETTCRERFSEGRSGAFMYYSSDQKCIVKTTSKQELQTLIRIMPSYLNYLSKNPDTLLVKFLGAHCITMYGREIYFLVMLNVFPNFKMSERYDLKGSWVKRHGFNMRSTMDRFKKESADPPLYLDNDLQHKISLHSHIVSSLASQIVRDIAFLRGKCSY